MDWQVFILNTLLTLSPSQQTLPQPPPPPLPVKLELNAENFYRQLPSPDVAL